MASMRGLTLAMLCTAAGGLVLCGASAQAAITREPIGSFGPEGPGASLFSEPQSIAVEQSSGDLYVYDVGTKGSSKGSIYKFNAAGEPVDFKSTGKNVIEGVGGGAEESEIAVDSSTGPDAGDIYVATGEEVKIYNSAGKERAPLATKAENREPCGVAVDPSGAVYVASYKEEAVKKYTPVTNPVGKGNETSTLYKVGKACNIAADSAGDLYAAGHAGKAGVTKYSASQFNTTGTAAVGTVFDSREGATLAVDPVSGNVYIDEQSDVAEYEASDKLIETFAAALSKSFGVAVNHSSDEVYVANGKTVEIFAAPIVTPDVSTGGAASVTRTTATLNGSVNPDSLPGVLCEFEYGTAAGSFGHTITCEQAPIEGSAPVPVSANLTGLTADSSYYYRLVAITENGKHHNGTEEHFKTPPAVEGVQTAAASDVLGTSATLNGSLEPNGFDTHYFFEYGKTKPFGSTTREDAGELNEVKQVATSVTGLEPNKAYTFRLVAENSFGTTPASSEEVFTTPRVKPAIHTLTTEVTGTTVGLIDALNPENSETKYHFVYGSSEAYGQSTPEVTLASSFGEETVDGGVIGELDPGTTLYYKLVATNQAGASEGPPQQTITTSSATPPTVTTTGASAVSQNAATISGAVTTNGLQTDYGFEIGTEAGDYGPATGLGSLGGATTQTVTLTLGELQPGTTYYYRVTATSQDGASYGEPATFTTSGFPILLTAPSAPPLIATPAIGFPAGSQENTGTTAATKKLTNAQKLTKALKACRKDKAKSRRANCEKQARKQSGPANKKTSKTKGKR